MGKVVGRLIDNEKSVKLQKPVLIRYRATEYYVCHLKYQYSL